MDINVFVGVLHSALILPLLHHQLLEPVLHLVPCGLPLLRLPSRMLIAGGLASGARIFMEDFNEAAVTLAEVAADVKSRPEVMHVSAVQVDGAAVLGCGWFGGVGTLAMGGGGSPVGGG